MKKVLISIICFLCIGMVIVCGYKGDQAFAKSQFDDMSARSYVVVDNSGNILLENNPDEKYEVASICKLMTTLITLEHIDNGSLSLDDRVVASKYACDAEGSQAFLDSGSEYTIRDLLKSVIVASANDSAIVLAESIGGSENNFVKLMNDKAKNLGMHSTLYANSTGLPAGNQYSTARDTAKLLNVVSKYNIYKEDCKIWMDKVIHPSGRETELVNTNRLIKYYPYCLTGKTGFTDEAGYCLSSTAEKNNLHLTCVVLGCDTMASRFTESMELYNYAFANFVSEKLIDSNEFLDNYVQVLQGRGNNIDISPKSDYFVTKKVGDNSNYDVEYVYESKVKAPININDQVGVAIIKKDGKEIAQIPLVSKTQIDKQKFNDVFDKVLSNFNFFE